jgi:hypothetical protein
VTPLARLARNLVQRAANVFYEGPEPPARLEQMVVDFANGRRRATRREWSDMARKLAREAYKSGFVRGFEATIRDDEIGLPKIPPELIADALDPDWRWAPVLGPELENPHDYVVEEVDGEPVPPPAASLEPGFQRGDEP